MSTTKCDSSKHLREKSWLFSSISRISKLFTTSYVYGKKYLGGIELANIPGLTYNTLEFQHPSKALARARELARVSHIRGSLLLLRSSQVGCTCSSRWPRAILSSPRRRRQPARVLMTRRSGAATPPPPPPCGNPECLSSSQLVLVLVSPSSSSHLWLVLTLARVKGFLLLLFSSFFFTLLLCFCRYSGKG